ncbi:phosphatidate cytidylyltransferase [uncultured Helicobacter sp.]|uniref:phosphatidate cytidylyltransferase n=1 Tax=uncultured Helicobacter sp. TaxID=175537 RepID=UPI00374F12D1
MKDAENGSVKKVFSADKQRYVTGALLIVVLVLILLINSKILIWFVLGALLLLSIKESLALYTLETALHFYILGALGWIGAYFTENPLYCGLIVLLLYASYIAYSKKLPLKVMLPFLYPTLPFLCIWSVYGLLDRWGLICLIAVVVCTDTGAYFGGKIFGKTPFSPTSPKKTIEGVVVGVACGTAVGAVFYTGITHSFPLAVVVALFVALASVFGDLFESYLKRETNLKDSGTIFPGHGGVLDRLDALLFAAIAMLFILSVLPLYSETSVL